MGYNHKSSFYNTAGPMASCLCYDNNDRTSDRGIPIKDIAIVSWKFGVDVGAKRDLIVFYVSNSTFLKIWLLDLCSCTFQEKIKNDLIVLLAIVYCETQAGNI